MTCRIAVAALIAALALCTGQASRAQASAWPDLSRRVGPYGGLRSTPDVEAAVAAGFNLTVPSTIDPAVKKSMRDGGMKYIEQRLWRLVYAQCAKQFAEYDARKAKRRCDISSDLQKSILDVAAQLLDKVKDDDGVVAYWILDDYPRGDIRPTLIALRALIAKANKETGKNKPTICGVGGSFDHRTATDPAIRPDRGQIELSLSNVTPQACDIVAPYFYGSATQNDPTWIDWSLSDLLPWFMRQLNERGFERPTILPLVQAFYARKIDNRGFYVLPRPQDIESLGRAYCKAGAISLMFFTWQSKDAELSYSNDASIREGVQRAVAACPMLKKT